MKILEMYGTERMNKKWFWVYFEYKLWILFLLSLSLTPGSLKILIRSLKSLPLAMSEKLLKGKFLHSNMDSPDSWVWGEELFIRAAWFFLLSTYISRHVWKMNEPTRADEMEAEKRNHESHACNLMNVRRSEERSFTSLDDKNSLLVMIFLRHVQIYYRCTNF